MKFIKNPNLPENDVNVVAISSGAETIIRNLESANMKVISVDLCSNLPEGISSHADLQILHLGGNSILTSSCSNDCIDKLKEIGFNEIKCDRSLGESYPNDCLINVAILENKIIANTKIIDKKLTDYVNSKNMEIIGVNQGYAKCSSLIVAKDAIITADRGIAEAAQGHGIEVLIINDENIYLKYYDKGFIGGCGGMIEKKLLGTSGDFKTLKDFDNIRDFLRNRNIYIENLGEHDVWDIGGILPLCEKE